MVEAATTFRKSGFNDEDAATLAKVAAQYQNVADTAVSAEDAASSIVSQIRAFGEDADFATHVIDAYNEVANNFSVGTNDLSQAMEIASAGMATYGNEFEEIIGLVTAGTEIMTGRSSQVARGLNTIASRIVKNQGALEEYGIRVEDTNGNLKSTYDVLSELKPKWDSMSEAERVALGDAIAGTNQYKVLASVMQNFEHATDATTTALNSSGSAIQENEAYMESLEAKTTAVKATFQDLANNVIDDELVGAVLDLANGFLQLANTDLGRIVTQITLLTGVGWGATGLLQASKIIPSVISQFKNFGAAASLAASGASGFFEALSVGGGVLTGILPVILAVAAALAVGGALWKATEDSRKSIDELNESIESDTQQLETNKARLAEINGMAWNDKTPEILAEKDALEKENAELQKQIDKYNELAKKQARQTLENAGTIETSYTEKTDRKTGRTRLEQTTNVIQGEEYYQKLIEKLREYQSLLDKNHELNEEQLADYQKTVSEASRLADAINILNPDIMTATESERQLTYALADAQEAMSSASSYVSNYVDGLYQTGQEAKKTGDALTEYVVNAIIDVNNTELSTGQKVSALQAVMSQADLTSIELVDKLANAIITVGNTNLDVSGQIANLQALALQAGYTAQAVAAVFGMDETTVSNQIRTSATGYMRAGLAKTSEEAMAMAKKQYAKTLWDSLKTSYTPVEKPKVVTGGGGGGGTSTSKQTEKNKEEAKDAVEEVKKDAESAVDDVSDSVSDALQQQKDAMQGVIDYYVEYASRQIEKIEEQLDAINAKYDEMLDAAQQRYDDQLAALEEQYNAIEDQYELQKLMDNLEKAKKTYQMVYRDGQFVYEVDQEAVREAQEALNAYKRKKEYEERKKQLEESLENEKEYLESLRKAETEALEEEKKRWEEYKKGWSELTSEYEFQQNKLLADQMFGAEQENATWETRLANLQSFVSQYNSLMSQIDGYGGGGSSSGGSGAQPGEWAGTGEGYKNDKEAWDDITNAYNPLWEKDVDYGELLEEGIKKGYGYDWIKGVMGQRNAKLQAEGLEGKVESTKDMWERLKDKYGYDEGYSGSKSNGSSSSKGSSSSGTNYKPGGVSKSDQSKIMGMEDEIERNSQAWFDADEEERKRLHERNEQLRKELEKMGYASGTTSARGGLAMVGEQGPELRVLNKGDGIVPADITRNLMKIGANPKWFAQQSGAANTILNVANVSLPSVQNAQQFVDGLKNLALQKAYGRT